MAVKKRNGKWYAYIRPFDGKQIGVVMDVTTKAEAVQVGNMITRACRTGNYGLLDDVSREACIRMFDNQRWKLPEALTDGVYSLTAELTFERAVELFRSYPGISESKGLWRHEYSIDHLRNFFGDDFPARELWIPEIKEYQMHRQNGGASPATINRELACLSKIFQVLVELQYREINPVRMVKRLSEKSGERQCYLSWEDFNRIVNSCPAWYRPIAMTAYYTGMRRGEILSLSRHQVNLSRRVIFLGAKDTKEGQRKRIPIHLDLVPVLEQALKVTCLQTDQVFLLKDDRGRRPLGEETFKNVWPRACESLEKAELLSKPFPRFHDLRHTWKTNARRSGMDSEIRESILGHSSKRRSVMERYGRISEEELLEAIASMSFDHGRTEILVAAR